MNRFRRVLKAYDFRGRIGADLDEDLIFAIGFGTARAMAELHGAQRLLIGSDMRPDSPRFAALLAAGVSAAGGDPVVVGLCSTDQLYFASGLWDLPGLMVTASHNPADWNGIKVCGPRAGGIGRDSGLGLIRHHALSAPEAPRAVADRLPEPDGAASAELTAEYSRTVRRLTGVARVTRPLRVVVDCGNGMAGKLLSEVFGTAAGLPPVPFEVHGLYTELDGTFPNHPANPLDPANLLDVRREVLARGADLGLAFDGDADRCFFIDETGRAASASAVGALVAQREIGRARQQGEDRPVVLHNLITSRAVPEAVRAAGGRPVRTPVGHSGIKRLMAEHSAVFACEHSAHFYFRDFFGADTGMLAACHVIAALAETDASLGSLLAGFDPYSASGEINSAVADPDRALDRFRSAAESGLLGAGTVDDLDGVMFNGEDFWCNVRKSNTEPLVRLNCETGSPEGTRRLSEKVLAIVRAEDAAEDAAEGRAAEPRG
ncbi:phosphomannomutase/phosphoglucomutase [Brevibacterium daeguense]|uniref:phosphomannomutase/phosphoglucomutase n=1 Tax=Brevibacterium daeguense TaxID=909936 RepID=UPI001F2372B3